MKGDGAINSSTAIAPAERTGGLPDALPERALAALADQLRPAGMFLAILDLSGEIVYRDTKASEFFQNYVYPLIRDPRIVLLPQDTFASAGAAGSSDRAIVFPGAFAIAMPFIER